MFYKFAIWKWAHNKERKILKNKFSPFFSKNFSKKNWTNYFFEKMMKNNNFCWKKINCYFFDFFEFFFSKIFREKNGENFFSQFFFLLYHQFLFLYCKVKNCLSIFYSCIHTSQYAIFKQFLPFLTLKMAGNRNFWKFLCLMSLHQ